MTTEQEAAVERLRDGGRGSKDQFVSDLHTVAAMYLAEHPPDDKLENFARQVAQEAVLDDLRAARRLLERFRRVAEPYKELATNIDAFLARTSYVEPAADGSR